MKKNKWLQCAVKEFKCAAIDDPGNMRYYNIFYILYGLYSDWLLLTSTHLFFSYITARTKVRDRNTEENGSDYGV
jgi:hypothetical protein